MDINGLLFHLSGLTLARKLSPSKHFLISALPSLRIKGLFHSGYPFIGVFAHFVFFEKSPFQSRGDCTIEARLEGMTLISHQFAD